MKRHGKIGLVILGCLIAGGLSVACSKKYDPSPRGPGVPRISNLRIQPSVVEPGGQTVIRFNFRDQDGDVRDVYLSLSRKVQDFTWSKGLSPEVISRGRYLGLTEGTIEETITVSAERPLKPLVSEKREYTGQLEPAPPSPQGSSRVYEIFVIDEKGHVSNRLRAEVTVR
jgi:hypothetical protein